jgi:hypothetical protein
VLPSSLPVLRHPTTQLQLLPHTLKTGPCHSSCSSPEAPHPSGYALAIESPKGTRLRTIGELWQKPEDQRLEGSIQCTDRAQETFTILINKEEILALKKNVLICLSLIQCQFFSLLFHFISFSFFFTYSVSYLQRSLLVVYFTSLFYYS